MEMFSAGFRVQLQTVMSSAKPPLQPQHCLPVLLRNSFPGGMSTALKKGDLYNLCLLKCSTLIP